MVIPGEVVVVEPMVLEDTEITQAQVWRLRRFW